MCHLHNLVNLRLDKPEFDCSKDLEGIYDCGCGSDEEEGTGLSRKGARAEEEGEKKLDERIEVEEREVEGDDVRRDPETGLELIGG